MEAEADQTAPTSDPPVITAEQVVDRLAELLTALPGARMDAAVQRLTTLAHAPDSPRARLSAVELLQPHIAYAKAPERRTKNRRLPPGISVFAELDSLQSKKKKACGDT